MARARHVVVLAIAMFLIIGLSRAADAPTSSTDGDYEEDDTEYLIGTRNSDAASPSSVVAAPIGGPVPPGAFESTTPPSGASSSLHQLSTVAGVSTAALAASFYF